MAAVNDHVFITSTSSQQKTSYDKYIKKQTDYQICAR